MDEIVVKISRRAGRKFLFAYYDDPLTGKRSERSTKTHKQRDAERFAARWEAELRAGKYKRQAKLTWEKFRERYESERLASLSHRTLASFGTAANHLERVSAPLLLGSITSGVMSTFQAKLREEKMSDASIDCHLRHLAPAFAWAVKMGLMSQAPQIERPKSMKGQTHMKGRPITTEEFERMLAAVDKKRPDDPAGWKFYLRGMWLSGLRLEESLIVSWDTDSPFSIDLSGKYPRFRIMAAAHKGRRDQFLPLTPDFAEFVLATPEAERIGPVFKAVQRWKLDRVSKIVSALGRQAKVVVDKSADKFATCHDLRRSFGTRWASKVFPAQLQQLMRHENIETTMKFYVHLNSDDLSAELWKGKTIGTFVGTAEQKATSDENEHSQETK